MSLTLAKGPLATSGPMTTNYEISGPAHRLLLDEFPRRVRATFAGATVLDTTRGQLLHESNLLPVLYVPDADVRVDLLEPTDHTTHCPFKGDASYWSIRVGDQVSENAAWAYPHPLEDAEWLAGLLAFYWGGLDAWFDEDERVEAHLRDPFHRVDVRRSSRRVVVRVNETVVAESSRPMLLSETGLPNRYYLPPADVRTDLLRPSPTVTRCPYKGEASYWSFADGPTEVHDVAWAYHHPLDDAARVDGHRCFASGDHVTVEVDGAAVA
ncbi:MAG: DUF427 domain-containing protein [Acidimicrobiales bacterium]